MDEENFTKDHILKHLEEIIIEVIIGALHYEMMVMLGTQYIIIPNEPNDFLEEDSFSEYSLSGSSLYDSDEVSSRPMGFSHDTLYFPFYYQDLIGKWLQH